MTRPPVQANRFQADGLEISPRCSVLIVNYNGGNMVVDCIRNVLAADISVEVLVWDNASEDQSLQVLEKTFLSEPRVCLFPHPKNIGFAAGVNRLIPEAAGTFILLLNPDCLVDPDTIARVMQALENNPEAGMAGCMICNPNGSEQDGCRRQVPTPWHALVRVLHLDTVFPGHPRFQGLSLNKTPLPENPVAVAAISGAFMLVTRQALQDVGPLDEGYFMHCEDLDWCMRFRQKGWQVLFVPQAAALHHSGYCSSSRPVAVEFYKHRGMVRFYRKFFWHDYPMVLMWLVTGAVWGRFLLVAGLQQVRRWKGSKHHG